MLAGLQAAGRTGIDHASRRKVRQQQGECAGGVDLADAGLCNHQLLVAVVGVKQPRVEVYACFVLWKTRQQRLHFLLHRGHEGNRFLHALSFV